MQAASPIGTPARRLFRHVLSEGNAQQEQTSHWPSILHRDRQGRTPSTLYFVVATAELSILLRRAEWRMKIGDCYCQVRGTPVVPT